jgi:putative nucleotidyltransferase with HDIG domain
MKTREEAWQLVTEFTQSDQLIRHMLAVEAAMRGYARQYNQDEEYWGIVGLIHDFDYERFPTMGGDLPKEEWHSFAGARILRERDWPEEVVQDVLSHADYAGVPRHTSLRKVLMAVDELTGFLIAVTLVHPSKNIAEIQLKSVRKKWKDKAFAAAVNRQEIEAGANELGVTLDEHIQTTLDALKEYAEILGLQGNAHSA